MTSTEVPRVALESEDQAGDRTNPVPRFWAHSANAVGRWHELSEHLLGVAKLARGFAEPFGAGDWGYVAGLLHDVGKFSAAFQAHLRRSSSDECHASELRGTVDHTSAGAQYAVERFPVLGHLLAYAISGHHGGLLDAISDFACLEKRLGKTVENWSHGLRLLVLPDLQLPHFLREVLARRERGPKGVAFSFAFFVRMLFSCLVDADFLDTEAFFDADRKSSRPSWPANVLLRMEEALCAFVDRLPEPASQISRSRAEIRQWCLDAASREPGFFSLTVPTGAGKTLSSLAFALHHARRHGLRRVIYVAPFTSIIEQNAEVFRRVFEPLRQLQWPDPVLEHHSAIDVGEETVASRLASENWDASLVVTTAVQFYESLFANNVSRCRKLHNISQSVVILDEAQKLPVDYLSACLMTLRELVANYQTTVVLCTATQPVIHRHDGFPIGLDNISEIVEDPTALYLQLRRVSVSDLGHVNDEELVRRLASERQVLCIVNTRRHARLLTERLLPITDVIHLSAAMCPEHRSKVLRRCRDLLAAGKPCQVISTQLIEAGVDLDFPVVYRSLAGLDALAQAAGRCNRNGRLTEGRLFLFRSEHGQSEAFLRDTANVAGQLLGGDGFPPLYDDPLSLQAIEHYFRLYYWEQRQRWDFHQLLDSFKLAQSKSLPFQFSFRAVAATFRLIEESGRAVVVPWGEKGKELVEELRRPGRLPARSMLRSLQRYTVQVPSRTWHEAIGKEIEIMGQHCAVLVCQELHYDERFGLCLERDKLGPDTLIV